MGVGRKKNFCLSNEWVDGENIFPNQQLDLLVNFNFQSKNQNFYFFRIFLQKNFSGNRHATRRGCVGGDQTPLNPEQTSKWFGVQNHESSGGAFVGRNR